MAHITFINASPRKNNCHKIVQYATSLLESNTSSVINTSEKNINFCKSCDYCKTHHICIQKDDCNEINAQLAKSDAIVFVTPVYFGNMSGQLKTLIDRTVVLRRDSMKLKDKYGAVLTTGGSRNGGQELTIQNIMAAMHIHGMIVVGDDNHFGGTVFEPFDQDEFGKQTVKSTIQKIERVL